MNRKTVAAPVQTIRIDFEVRETWPCVMVRPNGHTYSLGPDAAAIPPFTGTMPAFILSDRSIIDVSARRDCLTSLS